MILFVVCFAVLAAWYLVCRLVVRSIDEWLYVWRDDGVDRSFDRTREQIRDLPEIVRPYDWQTEDAA